LDGARAVGDEVTSLGGTIRRQRARAQRGELDEIATVERQVADRTFLDHLTERGCLGLEQRCRGRDGDFRGRGADFETKIDIKALLDADLDACAGGGAESLGSD